MINIQIIDGQVIVRLPKTTLVMSKAQFIEALRAGKRWKRQQAMATRLRPKGPRPQGGSRAAPDTGVVRL